MHVSEEVRRYAVALTASTRHSPDLLLGASPRATLHLVRAAKAGAAMDGRDFVVPDDVQAMAVPVLAHRLLPTVEASMGGRTVQVDPRGSGRVRPDARRGADGRRCDPSAR